jgi:glycosyltransferase involved in cell wall biosynthesis
MIKLYRLIKALWSLRDCENRKNFTILLRNYMDSVRQSRLNLTTFNAPYSVEYPVSHCNHKILLVIHEFSRTGAPYAILYLAQSLLSINGVPPVIISPKDGPIREEFQKEGFVTIVDPLLFNYQYYSPEACGFVQGFERVIVTSLACHNFVRYFRGVGKRLVWWIHETDVGFTLAAKMGADLPLLFSACESIWLGSPLCFPPASQYAAQDKLHLLLYGCTDTASPHRRHDSGKIIFSIVGSVEERKGQDIFLDAVELLPRELRCKAIFRIIGSPLPNDRSVSFCNKISMRAARIPGVECIANMPLETLQKFYSESSVIVSASRDDPMPIVITQGLMFSVVCLCSSVIGHAKLLKDGENGLIFASESAEELSEKMGWILQNPTELINLGTAGRALYEKYFLMTSFVENVKNLIRSGGPIARSGCEPK